MKHSAHAVDLIERFEGFRAHAYKDPVGIWTIGYGTTRGVKPESVITEPEGSALLAAECDLISTALGLVLHVPLTQNQFDACVSLAYNIGTGAFKASTLLRKLNTRDTAGAAQEFLRWDKAGKTVLPGLARRRAAEMALFLEAS